MVGIVEYAVTSEFPQCGINKVYHMISYDIMNTHLEQWAAPGEQLGVWCLAQGSQLWVASPTL